MLFGYKPHVQVADVHTTRSGCPFDRALKIKQELIYVKCDMAFIAVKWHVFVQEARYGIMELYFLISMHILKVETCTHIFFSIVDMHACTMGWM